MVCTVKWVENVSNGSKTVQKTTLKLKLVTVEALENPSKGFVFCSCCADKNVKIVHDPNDCYHIIHLHILGALYETENVESVNIC